MFRIVFRALLTVLCALFFHQVISAPGADGPYKERKMSTKAQIMSNVSMALYWALKQFIPIEMVPDKEEWLRIDGGVEDYDGGEIYG